MDGHLLFGGFGIHLVTQMGDVFKHVVFAQHALLASCQDGHGLLVATGMDGCLDGGNGCVGVTDVDGLECLFGEIVAEIGATVVEGEGFGQIAIGNLFCPIVGLRRVFDGDVILVGTEHVPLVLEGTEPSAKDVDLMSEMCFEFLHELDTVNMPTSEGFVAGDDGEQSGLLGRVGWLTQ